MNAKQISAAIAAAALTTFALPAGAVTVTYANFSQATSAKQFSYARVGPGAGTGNRLYTTAVDSSAPGAVAVDFRYLLSMPAPLQGFQDAMLTFDAATTETMTVSVGTSSQGGFTGSLSVRRVVPLDGKDNLLSISFTNATLFSVLGGSSASYTISIPAAGTLISQSSDFVDFGMVVEADFALSFSAVAPTFQSEPGGYGEAFRANATGTFASNPAPSFVPEPETWAMLITGFGLVGHAARRRRATGRVTA